MRQEHKDEIARLRYERDSYAQRAGARRQDAMEARRKRQWLDAIKLDSSAGEYRATRDHYAREIKRIKREFP